MRLKIATYNIQYGVGQDDQYDLGRTVAALNDQDIVCLQEVTTNWPRCRLDDQPHLISTRLNRFAVFATAYEVDCSTTNSDGKITNARQGFGNMVLSRWPILYSRAHSLPRPSTEIPSEFHPRVDFPRVALETVVEVEDKTVRVVSVHLSQLPGQQKLAQVQALKSLIDSLPLEARMWEEDKRVFDWSNGKPSPAVPQSTLILGDFNFEPTDDEYAEMTLADGLGQTKLVDGWSASKETLSNSETCVENDGSISRLDYMFITPNLAGGVHSARVDQSIRASDHYPIYFKLSL